MRHIFIECPIFEIADLYIEKFYRFRKKIVNFT